LKNTLFELRKRKYRFARAVKKDPYFPDIDELMAELLENISIGAKKRLLTDLIADP